MEYALLISMVMTGSVGTLDMLEKTVDGFYSETAAQVGNPNLEDFGVPAVDGEDTSTTTTSTTTTAPIAATTTTTTTTTTTSTTTTTTTSTTTTTTTTVQADESTTVKFKDKSNRVRKRAKVQIEFRKENGKKLKYADVVIRFVYGDGTSEDIATKTNSAGKVTIQRNNMKNDMWSVTVEIMSVTKGGAKYSPDWDSFVLTG